MPEVFCKIRHANWVFIFVHFTYSSSLKGVSAKIHSWIFFFFYYIKVPDYWIFNSYVSAPND